MDVDHLLDKRTAYLKALWYFEGNRLLPVVVQRRVQYQNARTAFLEHRRKTRAQERIAAALAAAEAEIARLRAAAETCLAALERVQPQARGVLVIDDIRKAIAEARAALEPQEATDGNG